MNPEYIPGERRCLEWDSSEYSRYNFRSHCRIFDVITYSEGNDAHIVPGGGGQRRYVVDIHDADAIIPDNSISIVVCTQIFEHLRRPHKAMDQLFRIIAPGGFVVWS